MILHVYIRKDEETNTYFSEIMELSGVFSQGSTVDECMSNTKEAIELALEDEKSREYFGIFDDSLHIEYIVEDVVNVG